MVCHGVLTIKNVYCACSVWLLADLLAGGLNLDISTHTQYFRKFLFANFKQERVKIGGAAENIEFMYPQYTKSYSTL